MREIVSACSVATDSDDSPQLSQKGDKVPVLVSVPRDLPLSRAGSSLSSLFPASVLCYKSKGVPGLQPSPGAGDRPARTSRWISTGRFTTAQFFFLTASKTLSRSSKFRVSGMGQRPTPNRRRKMPSVLASCHSPLRKTPHCHSARQR